MYLYSVYNFKIKENSLKQLHVQINNISKQVNKIYYCMPSSSNCKSSIISTIKASLSDPAKSLQNSGQWFIIILAIKQNDSIPFYLRVISTPFDKSLLSMYK